MARRVSWLREVIAALDLAVSVHHGRAEDPVVRTALGEQDVVTARAVAPLGRLVKWALPLVVPTGRLLAIKGAAAEQELAQEMASVRAAGGVAVEIVQCGVTIVHPPPTVVVVTRAAQRVMWPAKARKRKDR